MNKVILMGRLTRDPEVRYSQGERQMAIARYTLAVDRRGRNAAAGEQTAGSYGKIKSGTNIKAKGRCTRIRIHEHPGWGRG